MSPASDRGESLAVGQRPIVAVGEPDPSTSRQQRPTANVIPTPTTSQRPSSAGASRVQEINAASLQDRSTQRQHRHEQRQSSLSGATSQSLVSAAAQDVRQQLGAASSQLGQSLRHLYVSASSIGADSVLPPPPSYHNIPGTVPIYQGRSSGPPPAYDDVVNPHALPPTYNSLFGQVRQARKSSRGLLDLLRRLMIILLSTLSCTFLLGLLILIPFTMIIVGATHLDDCKVEHMPVFLVVGGLIWAFKNIIHCCIQCEQLVQQEFRLRHMDLTGSPSHSSGASPTNSSINQAPQASASSTSRAYSDSQQARVNVELASLSSDSTPPLAQHPQASSGRQRYISECQLKCSILESLLNCMLFGWFIVGCVIVYRNYEPEFIDKSSARYCSRAVYMYTFWIVTSACFTLSLFVGCICLLMVSSAIRGHREQDQLV